MTSFRMASPLGDIVLCAQGDYLTGLFFAGQKHFPSILSMKASIDLNATLDSRASQQASVPTAAIPNVIRCAFDQMNEFFDGGRKVFTVPHRASGSAFQQQVWAELAKIPYAESVSYGTIAQRLKLPMGASRAIGSANGRNPLTIIVPCHRVIAASGALTGYAGGLERKQALLRLEARHAAAGEEFCLRSA